MCYYTKVIHLNLRLYLSYPINYALVFTGLVTPPSTCVHQLFYMFCQHPLNQFFHNQFILVFSLMD